MHYFRLLPALLCTCVLLAGCARDMSSSTYSASSTAGKVLTGTILSARIVTVKAHDKLGDNAVGGLAGGGAGALAGSSIGSGNGQGLAAIGGAIVGALAGAAIEDKLSTSEGMEYLVKIDSRYLRKNKTRNRKIIHEKTGTSTNDEVKMDINTDLETDIVSVVQKGEPNLREGSRVYIVYHDDRPRLVPLDKEQRR